MRAASCVPARDQFRPQRCYSISEQQVHPTQQNRSPLQSASGRGPFDRVGLPAFPNRHLGAGMAERSSAEPAARSWHGAGGISEWFCAFRTDSQRNDGHGPAKHQTTIFKQAAPCVARRVADSMTPNGGQPRRLRPLLSVPACCQVSDARY